MKTYILLADGYQRLNTIGAEVVHFDDKVKTLKQHLAEIATNSGLAEWKEVSKDGMMGPAPENAVAEVITNWYYGVTYICKKTETPAEEQSTSIAQAVKNRIKKYAAGDYSVEITNWFAQDVAKEADGVYLREATAEDGIKSTWSNPHGWVYGFADGSQLAIVQNGEPVVIADKGDINYPQQKRDEEMQQQQAWLDTLPADALVIRRENGKAFCVTSRAWWISHALELDNGQISVARIEAKDKDGEHYMLELTEAMLAQYNLTPGKLEFPEVVDGARPRTNRIDRPTSQKTYWKLMDDLQNERWMD